jgi:hypothetical protein
MRKIKLYNGEVTLCMDPVKHIYWVEGDKKNILANSTGVLKALAKPQLVGWAARKAAAYWLSQVEPGESLDEIEIEHIFDQSLEAHKVFTKGKGKIGSHAHDYCEKHINWMMGGCNGEPPAMPKNPMVLNSAEYYHDWLDTLHAGEVEWLFAERKVYHRKRGFCGTVDAVYKLGDHYHIVDFKTGSGVWPEAALQCASYTAALAYEMKWALSSCRREIVHIPSSGHKMKIWDEARIKDALTGHDLAHDYETFLAILHTYNWILEGPNKWQFLRA